MKRPAFSEDEIVDLTLQWVKGEKEAFAALYDYYVENIYRFIYFKVRSTDAEDLTEITFIKAWENRKKYDPKKSSFSSWIYTIARNTVIDHYRVYKTTDELDPTLMDHNQYSNPKAVTEDSLTSARLKKAIEKLNPNFRDIVLLRFIEDLDYAEIAEVLGKSEGSIRIMQHRAVRELRDILKNLGFEE